jgi:hypothetical protein
MIIHLFRAQICLFHIDGQFCFLTAGASALEQERISESKGLGLIVDGEDDHQSVLHFWNPGNCAIASAFGHSG